MWSCSLKYDLPAAATRTPGLREGGEGRRPAARLVLGRTLQRCSYATAVKTQVSERYLSTQDDSTKSPHESVHIPGILTT